ncbi:hypothetical protein [Clostridium vincentii]
MPFEVMAEFDGEYVERMSFGMDVKYFFELLLLC